MGDDDLEAWLFGLMGDRDPVLVEWANELRLSENIDMDIYAHGKYHPMIEIIYQNVSAFSDFEITEFEKRCGLIITCKNIGAILEGFSKFINAHLRDLMKLQSII